MIELIILSLSFVFVFILLYMATDRFPQFEVATLDMVVADTSVTVEVNFPNDLTDGEVLEITKVGIFKPNLEFPVTVEELYWKIDISTRAGEVPFADGDLIWRASRIQVITDITAESGITREERCEWFDLTDGRGNGILVPAEKLFVNFDTLAYTLTPEWVVRIYYRIVKVSSKEVLEFLTSA